MDISSETLNIEDTIHISNDSKEGGKRGPWSQKWFFQHCRGIPGQRSRSELIGEWAEGRGLRELMGRGELGKGKSF